MSELQDHLSEWAELWGRVRGVEPDAEGSAVLIPADTDDSDARAEAQQQGLSASGEYVLLTAATAEIAAAHSLPEDAQVASAPMGDYDVAEISVFDHPVGGGRISVGEAAAVIGNLRYETPQDRDAYEPALLATLAEEAYLHGAHTLILIVDLDEADRFLGSGWTEAGRVLTFGRP
ncbi:hypothetical protein [Pseudarthrobacter sulfonivorans]|uniref:hypothetical protein n=1 Tax=Pseudarthrobacter sulfonivorans TaxID=121292 RepID=UPI002103B1F4|nr:hypothetical protein [Pseudarthrobacter sulfonivorans]